MTNSPRGLQTRTMLPGIHKVRMPLAAGVAEYWYVWRGGPRILAARGKTEKDLERAIAAQAATAAAKFTELRRPKPAGDFVGGLIDKYLGGPKYAGLSPRRQADLAYHLASVKAKFAELSVASLSAKGARTMFLDWRDSMAAHPCTADSRLGALAVVFGWAKSRGDIPVNPLEKWPRIYSSNRADLIWTEDDLTKLLAGADPSFRQAVRLATYTGLRLADLVRLTWAEVGEKAITRVTNKGRGKRVATIPIGTEAAALLAEIGRKDVGAVLTHSRGEPWTGWGLQSAMQRAKTDAKIKGLTFHDLRGTAATHFVLSGLTLADVAAIMGWSDQRVAAIARRYVSGEALAAGMLERIEQNKQGRGL